MKKIGFFIISIIFAFFGQSCKKRTTYSLGAMPTNYMTYVKFASPEYANYVVAERDEWGDYEYFCKIRNAGACCEDLFLGSSPYIELPNGYYLVDWKWGGFIYQPTNFLIDVKWEDVEHRSQRWEYGANNIITYKYLKEWGCTSYQIIDQYLHTTPPTKNAYTIPDWEGKVQSCENWSSSDFYTLESYLKEVEEFDRL